MHPRVKSPLLSLSYYAHSRCSRRVKPPWALHHRWPHSTSCWRLAMTKPLFLQLSPDEENKVEQLRQAVAADIEGNPSLQAFCTHSCYVRYLRARSWNLAKATKMLQETLKWRASYKPEALRYEALSHEGNKGRLYLLEAPDREGRPVVIMRPREDPAPNDNETRIAWLVYTLEAACALADAASPDGKMTWLIDYEHYTRKASPPLKVSLQTLHILQNHYPERLGKAVCYHPPAIFDLMWRAVYPFIDPTTYKKVHFVNKKSPEGVMGEHFDLDAIDVAVGGTQPVEQSFAWPQYSQRMEQYEQGLVLAQPGH